MTPKTHISDHTSFFQPRNTTIVLLLIMLFLFSFPPHINPLQNIPGTLQFLHKAAFPNTVLPLASSAQETDSKGGYDVTKANDGLEITTANEEESRQAYSPRYPQSTWDCLAHKLPTEPEGVVTTGQTARSFKKHSH